MLGIIFANPDLNSAAQKTLNVENWNLFVQALNNCCVDLGGRRIIKNEYDMTDKEFFSVFSADLSLYVSGNNLLEALAITVMISFAVSTSVIAEFSIAKILEEYFELKYALDSKRLK